MLASNQRKARSFRLQKLGDELARIDTALSANYSEHLYTQYELVKKEISLILKQRSEFLLNRTKQHYYFQGSRPSHLLAMKIRTNDQFADIPSNKTKNGSITTDPSEINKTFTAFYSDLYSSDTVFDKSKCVGF